MEDSSVMMTLGELLGTLKTERNHQETFRNDFTARMDGIEKRVRNMEVRVYVMVLVGGAIVGVIANVAGGAIKSALGM